MYFNCRWQALRHHAFAGLAQTNDPRRILSQSETSSRFTQFTEKSSVGCIFKSPPRKESSVAADDTIYMNVGLDP